MNINASIVAIALGSLIAASPDQAARTWESQRLANSTPEQWTLLIGWYRALGICLRVSDVLLAVDTIGF